MTLFSKIKDLRNLKGNLVEKKDKFIKTSKTFLILIIFLLLLNSLGILYLILKR